MLVNEYIVDWDEGSMTETGRVAYHRERAEQERRRASQAIDDRSKNVHIELALAHGKAVVLGGHRLRAAHDR